MIDFLFNTTDSTDLKTLAEKCPFTEGAVVYKARALFNVFFEKNEIFQDACNGKGNEKSMKMIESNEQLDITVYPNPTQAKVFISLPNSDNSSIAVKVLDASGKEVYENPYLDVTDGLANFTLNVENGIYFINILDQNNNQLKVEKLIINK